jgi:hypothetical protein
VESPEELHGNVSKSLCAPFLLVTGTTESGLAVVGGWGIYTPRLSYVAPGFDSLTYPVCLTTTVARGSDPVPLTLWHI